MKKKERSLLLLVLVGLLFAGSVFLYGGKRGLQAASSGEGASGGQVAAASADVNAESKAKIKVHVKGEVNLPGVYQLPEDSRVIDAIEAAGGSKGDGDVQKLNLASVVEDGAEVVVPMTGEGQSEAQSVQDDGHVDLNNATVAELDALPGIGKARAQAIVEYRTSHGHFLQIEDVKQVPGIGSKLYEQIKNQIVVR